MSEFSPTLLNYHKTEVFNDEILDNILVQEDGRDTNE